MTVTAALRLARLAYRFARRYDDVEVIRQPETFFELTFRAHGLVPGDADQIEASARADAERHALDQRWRNAREACGP